MALDKFRRACKLSLMTLTLVAAIPALGWKVEWDFEGGTTGQKVSGWSANGKSVYSRDMGYNSSGSARLTATEGTTGWGSWGGYVDYPSKLKSGDELWFRVRTFYPQDWQPSTEARQKFIRVRTTDSSGKKNEGYIDLYICANDNSCAFKFIFEGENQWVNIGTKKDHAPKYGVWETYELYVKLDSAAASNGGQALVRFWKNGELIKEITNRKTLRTSNSKADRTHLFTWWGNNGSPVTQSMWVDDVHITSSRPSATDRKGNPFIGTGDQTTMSPPSAPLLQLSK